MSYGMSGSSLVRRDDGGDSNNRNQRVPEFDPKELGAMLLKGGLNAAKKHYMISGGWILGILIAIFATGFVVDKKHQDRYNELMSQIDLESYTLAQEASEIAYHHYYQSKGWLSCDNTCQILKRKYNDAHHYATDMQRKIDAQVSDAKSQVGIFSTHGVGETRRLFWKRFEQGKSFAKRQSTWDIFFTALSMNKDEGLGSYLVRLLVNVLLNFLIGMFGALVAFMWTLWGLISSFQPNFAVGAVFFALAVMAACAFVSFWLIGLYTAGAGAIYLIGRSGGLANIEGGGRGGGRRQHVR